MLERIFEAIEFGDPWRHSSKSICSVVPIFRRFANPRGYVLLEETKDTVEITDTGNIGAATIKNKSDSDVFVRKGTLLKGDTQERAVVMGLVVPPQAEKTVQIQCVHASRGIRMGAKLQAAGVAPRRVMSSFMSRRSQAETWQAVSRSSGFYMSALAAEPLSYYAVPSDDLIATLESTQKFREEVEEILGKVPGELVDQVGIVVVDIKGVVGLEVFDHPDSWRSFSKSVVRSYADVLSEESTGLFEIKLDAVADAAKAFIKKIQEVTAKTVDEIRDANGQVHTATSVFEGADFVGEFTELAKNAIHVIATRKETQENTLTQSFTAGRQGFTEDPLVRWPRTSRHQPRPAHPYTQWTTSMPSETSSEVFRGKATINLMMALDQHPKTFNELHREVPVSTRTLSKRLHEGQMQGFITPDFREQNGRRTWALTHDGRDVLGWAAKKKAEKAKLMV